MEKQAYRVDEFCATHGIGRSKFYQEVAMARIKVFKVGRLTLISKEAARNWLQQYQRQSEHLPQGAA